MLYSIRFASPGGPEKVNRIEVLYKWGVIYAAGLPPRPMLMDHGRSKKNS